MTAHNIDTAHHSVTEASQRGRDMRPETTESISFSSRALQSA